MHKQIIKSYIQFFNETSSSQLKDLIISMVKQLGLSLEVADIEPISAYSLDSSNVRTFFEKDYTQEELFQPVPWQLYVILLPALNYLYQQKRIPKNVLYQSLNDLKWRLNEHKSATGEWGLTLEDKMWLSRLYHLRIFKLGSLQFEIVYSSEQEDIAKLVVGGDGVLSVHIMYGQDISKPASLDSLAQAKSFFRTYFPGFQYEYFYCKSWLLYPPNKKFLAEGSNISAFMDLFDIVDQEQRVDLPYKFIFYKPVEEVSLTDVTTSLQQYAFDHPESLGVGVGLIKNNEEVSR